MDSRKEKCQQYLRGYKSSDFQRNYQFERSSYEVRSKYKYYKTNAPRYPIKSKSDHVYREKFRSNFPYKKKFVNESTKKPISSTEDAEEEERKKKLCDAANKLLSKIKTWSAEKSSSQDLGISDNDFKLTSNVDSVNNEAVKQPVSDSCSDVKNIESALIEGKPKRIAHSKLRRKQCGVKKPVFKKSNQYAKSSQNLKKYDVNKATVKDFQNRIQQKLINEIMQTPKENLQYMLSDPKINPKLELKMSHLVKENKLLIAQKLRSLAESKMTLNTSLTNSQLLVDIDKLIDPVIETDLSVLPYELIKKMENIFEVQFEYSGSGNNSEGESQNLELECNPNAIEDETLVGEFTEHNNSVEYFTNLDNCLDNRIRNAQCEDIAESKENLTEQLTPHYSAQRNHEIPVETNPETLNLKFVQDVSNNIKVENYSYDEDMAVFECSTDEESIENGFSISDGQNQDKSLTDLEKSAEDNLEISPKQNQSLTVLKFEERKTDDDNGNNSNDNKIRKLSWEGSEARNLSDKVLENLEHKFTVGMASSMDINSPKRRRKGKESLEDVIHKCDLSESLGKKFTSTSCQTQDNVVSASTQTQLQLNDLCMLYGVALPKKSTDDSPASLLGEVNSIQNLINKLNERRFMIFLQLTRTSSFLDFINNKFTKENFIETISSGNICLVELLKQLLTEVGGS